MDSTYPEVQFLDHVVKSLVDYPSDVHIERTVDDMGVLLSLTCAKSDMGKVIGKEGNIAKSIRTVLRAVGMRNESRVNMKILDSVESGGDIHNI